MRLGGCVEEQEFYSWHDEAKNGRLLSVDGPLCNLGDLVRVWMHYTPTSLRPAVRHVLDVVEADETVKLYLTAPLDDAVAVPDAHVWRRARGAQPESRGRSGLLGSLRSFWLADRMSEQGLFNYALRHGQVAILTTDARRLGLLSSPDSETAQSPAQEVAVFHPVGAVWPHQHGADWTDAERDAMFKMRHLEGLSDQQIAGVAGCTRQIVAQQIGAKHDWKRKDWEGGARGWAPTLALLAECKLEPQPLQAVSKALSA